MIGAARAAARPAATSPGGRRRTTAARGAGSGRTPVRYTSVNSDSDLDTPGHSGTGSGRQRTCSRPPNPQVRARFRRWWQVLGSNQRRLSRRFYSGPIQVHEQRRDLRT